MSGILLIFKSLPHLFVFFIYFSQKLAACRIYINVNNLLAILWVRISGQLLEKCIIRGKKKNQLNQKAIAYQTKFSLKKKKFFLKILKCVDKNNKKKSQGQVYYDLKMICGRKMYRVRDTTLLIIDKTKRRINLVNLILCS